MAERGQPSLPVDIVAHCAGGSVARDFVRYGSEDVLDRPLEGRRPPLTGASKVRQALLIALPNHGSIYGLQRMMRGTSFGLTEISPELVATMPADPSAVQRIVIAQPDTRFVRLR